MKISNFAEVWNRRFETLIGHNNPTVWKTVEVLGDDAAETATALLGYSSGRVESRRKDFNKKLRNCSEDYSSGRRDLINFYMPSDTAYELTI